MMTPAFSQSWRKRAQDCTSISANLSSSQTIENRNPRVRLMSAFVRITDSSQTSRHVRFVPNSEVGGFLFDHLVGASEQCRRHYDA